jgi:hypothetical protein
MAARFPKETRLTPFGFGVVYQDGENETREDPDTLGGRCDSQGTTQPPAESFGGSPTLRAARGWA